MSDYEIRSIADLETKTVCSFILGLTKEYGTQVGILIPIGTSEGLMSRTRVKIKRVRDQLKSRGKKLKSFKIHSRTEDYDAARDVLILWTTQGPANLVIEAAEDAELELALTRGE